MILGAWPTRKRLGSVPSRSARTEVLPARSLRGRAATLAVGHACDVSAHARLFPGRGGAALLGFAIIGAPSKGAIAGARFTLDAGRLQGIQEIPRRDLNAAA
jgi:hypothetical protein